MKRKVLIRLIKLLVLSTSSLLFFMALSQVKNSDSIVKQSTIQQASLEGTRVNRVNSPQDRDLSTQAYKAQLQAIRMHNTFRQLAATADKSEFVHASANQDKGLEIKHKNENIKRLISEWERDFLHAKGIEE